jgi:hypothetical protein
MVALAGCMYAHSSYTAAPAIIHASRCLVILCSNCTAAAAAEFELLGQQQEVATKLEAAQQQLNDAQARAEAATAEGNSAREQLSQVCGGAAFKPT